MSSDWREGKGCGYINAHGKRAMIRCVKCGKENYAAAVTSGVCYACGYDANSDHHAQAKAMSMMGCKP